MDQDSSNGAGSDKRNWRERLGIGAKELPKLSDEFRDEPQPAPPPPAGTARPAPRAPVTKPAPMAPRVAPRAAQPAADAASASSAPAVPPALSRATPKVPDNAAQDALAEKLRAQRAAAERLAEQRVQAARNRAEGRKPDTIPQRPAMPPARPGAAAPRSTGVTPPPPGGRPKFSFADERGETPRLGGAAPLTPPRPALGGERSTPPFLRPSANGSLGARPQPALRPAGGEASAGAIATPRLQAPGALRTGLGSDAPGLGSPRLPTRRAAGLDTYARPAEPREYVEEDFDEEGRATPRLGRPGAPARGRVPADDLDEVFEDEQPPRGRAAARDFPSAYGDGEQPFADERRRSSGPWILLLALLGAAVLVGGLVWLYSDHMKSFTGVGQPSATNGATPVVPAPADPAKVAAPDANSDSQSEAPAARKKQIYDRIVGEQEVTGEVQPTEEPPVPPEAAQPDAGQPAAGQPAAEQPAASGTQPVDQVPKVEPSGNANTIPVPDAPNQGTTGQGLPDPETPAPLPIPGSDQQGNLGLKGGAQVAAAATQPDQGATAPPPLPASPAQTTSSDATLPPPPEKATDGAALVSGAATKAATAPAAGQVASAVDAVTPEPDTAPAATTAAQPQASAPDADQASAQDTAAQDTPAPAPAKKKTAAKKASSKTPDYNNLGSKPVVLVPPSKQATADAQASTATDFAATAPAPAPATEPPAAQAAPSQKRKTIFDLFNTGSGAPATGAEQAAPTQIASAPTQAKQATAPVAPAVQKAATPPAQPQAAPSAGYVVQLASFRTDGEAKAEYSRLAAAYPGVVGPLKSQIRQTTVGGSTRYQLGLGPLPTRGDATRVCSDLISAGESDCIVRGP